MFLFYYFIHFGLVFFLLFSVYFRVDSTTRDLITPSPTVQYLTTQELSKQYRMSSVQDIRHINAISTSTTNDYTETWSDHYTHVEKAGESVLSSQTLPIEYTDMELTTVDHVQTYEATDSQQDYVTGLSLPSTILTLLTSSRYHMTTRGNDLNYHDVTLNDAHPLSTTVEASSSINPYTVANYSANSLHTNETLLITHPLPYKEPLISKRLDLFILYYYD
jgi:hypothetical protein